MARHQDRHAGSPRRAAIYCRISDDQSDGWGIGDQEQHCRKLAAELGWTVVEVYADNDTSISRYSKRKRPGFEQLKADIAAERIDAILVTESSRLFRRELEGLLFEADYGAPFKLIIQGLRFKVDFATTEGVFEWKLRSLIDAEESEQTRQRVLRKEASNAQRGLPKKGRVRKFGYEEDHITIVPAEAALIREAAERFLSGESLGNICRDWNARDIRNALGNQWSVVSLRRLLRNPQNVGYRNHPKYGMIRGIWPPILDRVTWDRVQTVLNDPKRRKFGQVQARRYLLTGLLYCGQCGSRMSASPRYADGVETYLCRKSPGYPGCGNVRRVARPVDNLIREYIFGLIERAPEIMKALKPNIESESRLAQLALKVEHYTQKLQEISDDYYVDETITKEQFLASSDSLKAKLEAVERERRNILGGMTLVSIGDASLREAWETRGLAWQRALIDALIEKIIIHQVSRRGRAKFDPSKIEVIWKDAAGDQSN